MVRIGEQGFHSSVINIFPWTQSLKAVLVGCFFLFYYTLVNKCVSEDWCVEGHLKKMALCSRLKQKHLGWSTSLLGTLGVLSSHAPWRNHVWHSHAPWWNHVWRSHVPAVAMPTSSLSVFLQPLGSLEICCTCPTQSFTQPCPCAFSIWCHRRTHCMLFLECSSLKP